MLKNFERAATRHAGRSLAAAVLALSIAVCAAAACCRSAHAQDRPLREFQVEAVFLFNFTQFVEWPASAFADAHMPLAICVVGEDPFGTFLDETVRGETAAGRPLIVRRSASIEDAGTCHVLFISRSESPRLAAILDRIKDRNMLTVSDAEDFGRRGGMVRFLVEDRHVKLRINLQASKAAGLTISSKLLRIAEITASGADR